MEGLLLIPVAAGVAWLIERQVRYDYRGRWRRSFRCKSCSHIDYYAFVTHNPCEACGEVGTKESVTAKAKFWGGYEIKGDA